MHWSGRPACDLHLCLECGVEHIEIASDARPTAYGAAYQPVQEDSRQYSPADFLRKFATVIAVCLGMALLAHVIVTIAGQY